MFRALKGNGYREIVTENVTANILASFMKEQMALAAGGFATLANAGGLNDATEELAGLDLTFDGIKIPANGSIAFEIPDGGSV